MKVFVNKLGYVFLENSDTETRRTVEVELVCSCCGKSIKEHGSKIQYKNLLGEAPHFFCNKECASRWFVKRLTNIEEADYAMYGKDIG